MYQNDLLFSIIFRACLVKNNRSENVPKRSHFRSFAANSQPYLTKMIGKRGRFLVFAADLFFTRQALIFAILLGRDLNWRLDVRNAKVFYASCHVKGCLVKDIGCKCLRMVYFCDHFR